MSKTRQGALQILKRFKEAGVDVYVREDGSVSVPKGEVARLFGYLGTGKKRHIYPALQILTRQNRSLRQRFIVDYSIFAALISGANPDYWERVKEYLKAARK